MGINNTKPRYSLLRRRTLLFPKAIRDIKMLEISCSLICLLSCRVKSKAYQAVMKKKGIVLMKNLVLPAVLALSTLAIAPQVQAQTAAQLANITTACATSPLACGAAIRTLRAGIAALPPAQRRAVVANIVTALRTQAATAPAATLRNISAGLTEFSNDVDDPVQLAAVTSLAAELADGDIDDQDAFDTAVEDTVEQALGGSPA